MKEYTTTAVKSTVKLMNGDIVDIFNHFGIHPGFANVYGRKEEDIINVKCTITDTTIYNRNKNRDADTEVNYWGWISKGKEDRISMIYSCWLLFDICFPAGAEATENFGDGKCVNLNVEQI